MENKKEIDGLRAIAVFSVMLFHAGFNFFKGGYIGVDIFFVISGYLITSNIINDINLGQFTLVNFWERRARRICPALFFILAVSIPIAVLVLFPSDLKDFSKSLIAATLFISNIYFYNTSGYFDNITELKPLIHTWSLAIEGHFYLLFPLLMFLWYPKYKKRLHLIILGGFVFSYLASVFFTLSHHHEAAFFLTPTRLWELFLGVIGSLCQKYIINHRISTIYNNLFTLFGILCIFYSVIFFDKNTSVPWMLIPTIGTLSIILFSKDNNLVKYILSQKFLTGLGLISYSAYLWHQPVFAFARYKMHFSPNSPIMLLLIGVSILLAILTYKFVEQPFRYGRNNTATSSVNKRINQKSPISICQYLKSSIFVVIRTRTKFVFTYNIRKNFFLITLIFIFIGAIGISTNGLEKNFIKNNNFQFGPRKEFYDLVIKNSSVNPLKKMIDNGACKFSSQDLSYNFEHRYLNCVKTLSSSGIIVLGDSHGMSIYNIIAKSNASSFISGLAKPACRPSSTKKECQYDDFLKFVAKNKSIIRLVIFHQSGSYLGGEHTVATINYLSKLSKHAKVIWLGPYPEARFKFKDISLYQNEPMISDNVINYFNLLESDIDKNKLLLVNKITFIKFSTIFPITKRSLKIGQCITFRDDDHFSECGENLIAPYMRDYLSEHISEFKNIAIEKK